MAKPRGLYTPVYASLPRHAKVQAAATSLVCDRIKLVGHLVSLWTWCLTGPGGALTAPQIALAAEWPERSANRFCEALADAGLLERVDGGYIVHEWNEYGGKVAGTQQYDRERHAKPPEIPQRFPGTSSLDETRRDEITRDKKVSDPPKAPQSPDVRAVEKDLADSLGLFSPPIGWAESWLQTRTVEQIHEAIGIARERGKRFTRYIDGVLENTTAGPSRVPTPMRGYGDAPGVITLTPEESQFENDVVEWKRIRRTQGVAAAHAFGVAHGINAERSMA